MLLTNLPPRHQLLATQPPPHPSLPLRSPLPSPLPSPRGTRPPGTTLQPWKDEIRSWLQPAQANAGAVAEAGVDVAVHIRVCEVNVPFGDRKKGGLHGHSYWPPLPVKYYTDLVEHELGSYASSSQGHASSTSPVVMVVAHPECMESPEATALVDRFGELSMGSPRPCLPSLSLSPPLPLSLSLSRTLFLSLSFPLSLISSLHPIQPPHRPTTLTAPQPSHSTTLPSKAPLCTLATLPTHSMPSAAPRMPSYCRVVRLAGWRRGWARPQRFTCPSLGSGAAIGSRRRWCRGTSPGSGRTTTPGRAIRTGGWWETPWFGLRSDWLTALLIGT